LNSYTKALNEMGYKVEPLTVQEAMATS